MPTKDYIPHKEADLFRWVQDFTYALAKNGARWQIPPAETAALVDKRDVFNDYFNEMISSERTKTLTAKKNEAKKELVAAIRAMVRFRFNNPAITDTDRVIAGLPPRDRVRTPHESVEERVDFTLELRGVREILVDFWIFGETHKAKPQGYDGAVVIWDVLGTPPERPESLTRHTMASRTPYAIEFDETERGKTVYVALAWQNERGLTGQWSVIKSAVIP